MSRFLLVAMLLPLLAACETLGLGDGAAADSRKAEAVSQKTSCPPVILPTELAAYGVKGANPMDMEASAALSLGEVTCDHMKDDGLAQKVKITLTATKGPGLKAETVAVPFFAAVVTPKGDVLAKKLYRTTFKFDGDMQEKEELALTFDLTPEQADGNSIYIGFNSASN